MWKILLALLLICPSAFAQQWEGGTGEQTILGTSNAALIGYNSFNKIVNPLNSLLYNYCTEYLQYASSSTITIVAGSCVDSNSTGSVRLFIQDLTNTTLTSANLDTGSITASTTYYVYSTAATNAATTSTYYISASSTAPSGVTYYYQIGKFTTDSNSQFTGIINNGPNRGSLAQLKSTKSTGVVYQALTDGFVNGNLISGSNNPGVNCYTDSSSSPSTNVGQSSYTGLNGSLSCSMFVRKGDYWEVSTSGSVGSSTVYFTPTSN